MNRVENEIVEDESKMNFNNGIRKKAAEAAFFISRKMIH
jgi:hypothetical protein